MPGTRHGIKGAPARSRATNSVHPLAFSTARRSSGQRWKCSLRTRWAARSEVVHPSHSVGASGPRSIRRSQSSRRSRASIGSATFPTISRLVDSSTIRAEPEVDPRRESGRGRGRHLSGDHQLVGLALHLVARFRLAGEIGAGGARAPAGPPFSTRRPPSHSRRSLREGSGARRSALKEAGPTYPDARHQSLSHPATVQHHDHPTGTAGCDSPARKPPWLIASRRPNGKSAPAGPRITGCGRSSQPCTWAGRDSLKGCVIRVNNSGRPLSAPSE